LSAAWKKYARASREEKTLRGEWKNKNEHLEDGNSLALKGRKEMINIGEIRRVWWQDATLFVYFSYFITYIHSFNHIHSIHLSFAIC
jgi:hypothetical protein